MSNDNTKKNLVEEIFDKARRGNKEALRELESLAENQDAEALNRIAEIYLKGLGGVEQLPKKSLEFLHRAAAQNYVPALYCLGDFYCYGKGGLSVDARKAVEYLSKAAALGEWKSYRLLGEIYLNNEGGIEADGCKVIEYLLKYAEEAQRQMTDAEDIYLKEEINEVFKTVAELYLYGKCEVTQDGCKAIENFAKIEDWFSIARIHEKGCGDIAPNREKAIAFYKKSGDSFKSDIERLTKDSDEPDYEFLSDSYRYGINGVKQNGKKALEYLIHDFEENPDWESGEEILQIYLYGCGELKPDWHKAFEFANIHFGGLLIYDNELAFKFACVFDNKLGYFRKDGLRTLAVLDARRNRLEKLKAPKIVMANELRRTAEIYEEGFGGLEPNREKSIEFYKQILALVPGNKGLKGKLAYLTGSDKE